MSRRKPAGLSALRKLIYGLVVAVAALLVKPEALEYEVPIHYKGFEIPSEFVIGYGLDYDGLGRQLPEIYQLDEG